MTSSTPTIPDGPTEYGDAILLRRFSRAITGDCDQCGETDSHPTQTIYLSIELGTCYVVLCPAHEGELLTRLLRNYLKRRDRKSEVGYTAPVVKVPTPDEDETEYVEVSDEDSDDHNL